MIKVTTGASLAELNTFGIDARVERLIEWDNAEELADWLKSHRGSLGPEILCIGRGSNLLFATPMIMRTAILSRAHSYKIERSAYHLPTVTADAGADWDKLVQLTIAAGLHGLECLSGIPGTVGASAVQNIGAYGVEVKDHIISVETIDSRTGNFRTFLPDELTYAYRYSVLKRPEMKRYIVTKVKYALTPGPYEPKIEYAGLKEAIESVRGNRAITPDVVREAVIKLRNSKLPDPAVIGNAGSFFTNPIITTSKAEALLAAHPDMPHWQVGDGKVKISAAWLIDKAGWKGRAMGRAGVYNKQPLVLVNRGNADGADIIALAMAIVSDISSKFGVTLKPEVNFI